MKEYTSQKILKGIVDNNSIVIQYVYDQYFDGIRKFIEKFGGDKDDALDIFQDAIIVIYEQIRTEEISTINNFKTYLFSVCKFKWYNHLRDNKLDKYSKVDLEEILPSIEYKQESIKIAERVEKEERVRVYFNSFMELSITCRLLIRYIAHGWTVKNIAEEMNLTVTYTYRKRHDCINKLINKVKEKLKI